MRAAFDRIWSNWAPARIRPKLENVELPCPAVRVSHYFPLASCIVGVLRLCWCRLIASLLCTFCLLAGQKQRVSLARAAYSCPDLVLLDDPLSALDAGTAKEVFSRLIKSPSAFFRSTAVVLVTHAAHFLNRVDSILVVVDGRSKFLGTWDELAVLEPQDDKTQGAINFIRNSVQEENSSYEKIETKENNPLPGNVMEKSGTKTLMTVEEREHGLSSMRTWLLWFNHAGGMSYMGVMVFLMVVDRFAYVATEYWLARWTGGADSPIVVFGITFAPQTDGRSAQYQYLLVYFVILLVSMVFTVLRYASSVRSVCTSYCFGACSFLVVSSHRSEWSGTHSPSLAATFETGLVPLNIVSSSPQLREEREPRRKCLALCLVAFLPLRCPTSKLPPLEGFSIDSPTISRSWILR